MEDCIVGAGLLAIVYCSMQEVFTSPSFCNFLTLATGWVLCRGRRTTTGLIRGAAAVHQKHFSCFHRFFADAIWGLQQFWFSIVCSVVEELCPHGPLILVGDDTVQGKSGKKISGASNWRNACGSTRQQYRFLWGLNWVILGLVVEFLGKTFCLPINLRLYRKKQSCQKLGRSYQTRSDLMRQMADEVVDAFPDRTVVLLVDGHFATKKVLRSVPETTTVITRLRKDAAIYLPPSCASKHRRGPRRKKGKRLPVPEQIALDERWPWQVTPEGRELKTLVMLWYGVTKTRRLRLVIVKQNHPRQPYGYYLCTRASWAPDKILSTYQKRWPIEITIREAKQHGGLGDAQCRKPVAVERQAAFTLGMMTVIMTWYMAEGHKSDVIRKFPWYRRKTAPTFSDMLAHARRRSLLQIINPNSAPQADIAEIHERFLSYLKVAA
jgi:hypothetical protein